MQELAKLDSYEAEIRKHWESSTAMVQSKRFFSLWEDGCQPQPFPVPPKGLKRNGKPLLPASEEPRIAHVEWDDSELCVALVAEGTETVQRVLLRPSSAGLDVEVLPAESLPLPDSTYGERVEIMAEALARIHAKYPGLDLSKTGNALLAEALEELQKEDFCDKGLIQAILKGGVRRRRQLLDRVLEDMADDETSNQLTLNLPLTATVPPFVTLPQDDAAEVPPITISERTSWQVRQDIHLLAESYRILQELEEKFVMTFGNVEVLASDEAAGMVTVKMPLPKDATGTLREGSQLTVFRHGNPRQKLGTFVIHLIDGDELIALLKWEDPAHRFPFDDFLCAAPRRTPHEYIAKSLQAMEEGFQGGDYQQHSVFSRLIGFAPLPYLFVPCSPQKGLDAWQSRALKACLNEQNPAVLVQGPPGTGKTRVLSEILREFRGTGRRILLTAPSNAAVDALCRHLLDMPLVRQGSSRDAVDTDIAEACWHEDDKAMAAFRQKREEQACEIWAGTHMGLLRSLEMAEDIRKNGLFDIIVFDEAGMTSSGEALLCLCLASRALIFGDPQQLPPFPVPPVLWKELEGRCGCLTLSQRSIISGSFLAWLHDWRGLPYLMLRNCYRCQNPRLMRFSSMLFYNAMVKTAETAEYFRLDYRQREQRFPKSTLHFISTSKLPLEWRRERLLLGQTPILENPLEAAICASWVMDCLPRYALEEITVITPYRGQAALIRRLLLEQRPETVPEETWQNFLHDRISTVDSFQGGESDVVIISYVRSGGKGIGFVDDPSRVNVTHTRSRREMIVVGDGEHLCGKARNRIFLRMLRAFARDGIVEELTEESAARWHETSSTSSTGETSTAISEPGERQDSDTPSKPKKGDVKTNAPQQLTFDFMN